VRDHRCGWAVRHGDVDALTAVLRGILDMPQERLEDMGRAARNAVDIHFSHDRLLGAVCDVIEGAADGCREHRA
jgi:hypothetical protein